MLSLESQRVCQNLFSFIKRFVLLYNKSLNDWSLGKQGILFLSNPNVSLDFVSEILGSQISLFPSGPVIKCEHSRKRYFCFFFYKRFLVKSLDKFGVTLKIIYRATRISWSSQAIVYLVSFFFSFSNSHRGK